MILDEMARRVAVAIVTIVSLLDLNRVVFGARTGHDCRASGSGCPATGAACLVLANALSPARPRSSRRSGPARSFDGN
jgi:predicted NBD/HSP70 family sugar kinase